MDKAYFVVADGYFVLAKAYFEVANGYIEVANAIDFVFRHFFDFSRRLFLVENSRVSNDFVLSEGGVLGLCKEEKS